MRILIAEDETISRTILKKTIESFGHECLVARDGAEAWELFQDTSDIEVVVSDWMMPEMDGLELCHKIRNIDRPGYPYFIFLTALGGQEHLLEGMRAGADEYLTKPLDREQLRARLVTASRVASVHQHLHGEGRKSPPEEGNGVEAKVDGSATTLRQQRPRLRKEKVWDVLVAQDKLSEEQLQQALEVQKNDRRDLGKVLVSLGFISDRDVAQAEAQRLKLSYVELDNVGVDREAVKLVPEKLIRKHGALPLYFEDGRLVAAMSDPTNLYALEDLRMIAGYPIVPVVVTEEDLQQALNRVFEGEEQFAEVLDEVADTEVRDLGDLQLGVEGAPDEAPVVRLVNSMLQRAISEEASDIHLEPQSQELVVRLRVDGALRRLMSVPSKLQSGVIARLKVLANLDIAERRVPQDGRFSVALRGTKVDLRVASLPTVYGEEIVLRLLDNSSLQVDLEGLGFSSGDLQRYREIFRRPYGTILVTGPTGSGKSTTLYSTLSELDSVEKKIITVEDPVESRMQNINQVQVNPKAGLTFASGLRSILRNDPDIVMIGEIRDTETAKISMEAAMTGHLVLSTLHTNDAPGALTRLTDMGVEPFLISSAVDCVIAQRLARRLCERCKEPVEVEKEVLTDIDFPFEYAPQELRFHRAVGCQQCGGRGYRGRIGLYELMMITDEIRELIVRRGSNTQIARAAEQEGMIRLRDNGLLKAALGSTTIEEVLRTVV